MYICHLESLSEVKDKILEFFIPFVRIWVGNKREGWGLECPERWTLRLELFDTLGSFGKRFCFGFGFALQQKLKEVKKSKNIFFFKKK